MKPQICLIKVTEPIDAPTFRFLLGFADAQKRERIERQRAGHRADSMAVGAALAKYMIQTRFGIPASRQRIEYGEHGKPYLPDYPDVHFNISHSDEYIVCAVCDRAVGIDIQTVREYNSALAERYFSDEEITFIEQSGNKALAFTTVWAQREAYGKMLGRGIYLGKEPLGVSLQTMIYENAVIALSAAT